MTSPGRKNDNGIAMMSSSAATSDCLISWRGAIAPRGRLVGGELDYFSAPFCGRIEDVGRARGGRQSGGRRVFACSKERNKSKKQINPSLHDNSSKRGGAE